MAKIKRRTEDGWEEIYNPETIKALTRRISDLEDAWHSVYHIKRILRYDFSAGIKNEGDEGDISVDISPANIKETPIVFAIFPAARQSVFFNPYTVTTTRVLVAYKAAKYTIVAGTLLLLEPVSF